MSQSVRVRFAPSPTGYLHVGGARTALYNYLYAKQKGGTFILRIEDTDLERSTDESLRQQISDLQWLGLHWDEGVDPENLESFGPHGPYRQSERLPIYQKYAQVLLQKDLAYYDFRTDEELERIKQSGEGSFTRIPRPSHIPTLSEARERIQKGEPAAIRFKVEGGKDHKINDLVRGEVTFPEDMVGDFILMRSNGMPVYNFCCAIDDALMEISHVFRAEEHLSNTLRQVMILQALDFPVPQFGHLSLILGADKQKLSKRHGATSCHQYREMGYLPQALLNFVALLGWSAGGDQEILSVQELIDQFSVERLQKSGAVFDEEKFRWMNSVHLRNLSDQQLWAEIQPWLENANIQVSTDPDFIQKSLTAFRPKMESLVDSVELYRPLDDQGFRLDKEASEVLSWPSTPQVLAVWKQILQQREGKPLSGEDFDQALEQVKKQANVKGKNLFMPIRVAIIGKPHGPDLKTLLPLLSVSSLLERVSKVESH
jgi:nondiscriminating glutamyl-tRNA synthetase